MANSSGKQEIIFKSLATLDDRKRPRVENLTKLFEKKFNSEPQYVICAPGRVNLIGDHIDYHGFSVLPMAIEKCILLCCRIVDKDPSSPDPVQPIIQLCNTDPRFSDWCGDHGLHYGSNLHKSHQWHNYILCGYHGVLASSLLQVPPSDIFNHAIQIGSEEKLVEQALPILGRLQRLEILVDSDLPIASGLSSSSALICASSLATSMLIRPLLGTEGTIDNRLLAESCSYFEHLIGTHGGGMDQAVILTAQEGFAKFVEFDPKLSCNNVQLPEGVVWLISHCGSSYPKAATTGFNMRVLETKLGAAMIAKTYQLESIDLDRSITLGKIKRLLFDDLSAKDIVAQIRREVFDMTDEFELSEICHKLDMNIDDLTNKFMINGELLRDSLNCKLKVAARCEHIFEEAERVERFKATCGDKPDLKVLGQLMLDSHCSLRDKYECSHPALDNLVTIAIDSGALGSRLTGAGWGGCIVTLAEASMAQKVAQELNKVAKFTFATEPQSGCFIINNLAS